MKDKASILYINNIPNSIAQIPSNISIIETTAILLNTKNPSIMETIPNIIKDTPANKDTNSALNNGKITKIKPKIIDKIPSIFIKFIINPFLVIYSYLN